MKTSKNILKTTALALGCLAGVGAQADGFQCVARNSGLNLKLYNHTGAPQGTRAPAILVISNPEVQSPNKTIAKFSGQNGTLSYQGYGVYEAKVDLRFKDTQRGGEWIAGTKLNQLQTIKLNLNFSYDSTSTSLARMDSVSGKITYLKRNGEQLVETVSCKRYLKSEI